MEQARLDIADRLRTAIESGALTEDQEERGESFLSRLKSPVRIAVLGPRRAGKSSLLNVLAGARVLPEGKALPTLQLTWGDTPSTTCIYGDGTRRSFTDAKPHDLAAHSPIFIEMRRRLPALRTVALLEVVMDGTHNQKSRALAWAAQRCDLALWCTAKFDTEEQALWEEMPEALHTHATLVLTRADKFETTEAIADRLAELGAAAAGRFRDVRPLASLQALSAFHSDGSAQTDVLQRSGGHALINSLLVEVEKGRGKIRSAAEAFLEQAQSPELVDSISSSVSEAHFATDPSTIQPKDDGATGDPIKTAKRRAKVISKPASSSFVTPQATPQAASEASQPVQTIVASPVAMLSEDGRDALESVVSYLSDRAQDMTEMLVSDSEDPVTEDVLPALLDDANWLVEFLESPFHEDDMIVEPVRAAALDITDLIQLMELERDTNAAADAACLMLQAKRDIQALLAAA